MKWGHYDEIARAEPSAFSFTFSPYINDTGKFWNVVLEKDGEDQLDVRNEEVLLRVKEQRNILHEIRKRKDNWIGHILRRNCLLQ